MRKILAPSLRGMKKNLVPGLILQACALLIVVGYAISPGFHALLDRIGELKSQYGFAYSAIATALFGGFIPFIVLRATGQVNKGRATRELIFYVAFWCYKGIEVDAFYRLQTMLFGTAASFGTIAAKTAVDMFVYNPLWAGPSQVLCFLWKNSNFSWSETRASLRAESLTHRLLIIITSTWMVWLPAVAVIYSLPSALQIPLFNLVLCFWCLLYSFVSRAKS